MVCPTAFIGVILRTLRDGGEADRERARPPTQAHTVAALASFGDCTVVLATRNFHYLHAFLYARFQLALFHRASLVVAYAYVCSLFCALSFMSHAYDSSTTERKFVACFCPRLLAYHAYRNYSR